MDDIDMALTNCTGLIDTSQQKLKLLVELIRALRERLSDTQINLKPVAARLIGLLLSIVTKTEQAKLGKLVYAPLINCVMNDIKKSMRDASLVALNQGTTSSTLNGGGINGEAVESFISSLVGEVTEASVRVSTDEFLKYLFALISKIFPS